MDDATKSSEHSPMARAPRCTRDRWRGALRLHLDARHRDAAGSPGYTVSVDTGITPTTTADRAAAIARHYLDLQTPALAAPEIHTDPIVRSVSAVRAADAPGFEPRVPADAVAVDPGRVVWVAAVTGDFLNLNDLPWSSAGHPYPSGNIVIDDASGTILGVYPGPPGPTARPSLVTPAAEPEAASSPSAPPTFCPGRTWPPYALGGIPGITAVSTDRATVEITNHTGRTYYYRVSGWELAQFETCRAFGELERQRGPIRAGATESVMVDPVWQQAGLRFTVALWDKPCGEACTSEPLGAIVVELSPLEPANGLEQDPADRSGVEPPLPPASAEVGVLGIAVRVGRGSRLYLSSTFRSGRTADPGSPAGPIPF